ncbi:MAG: pyridoxamine 5'-phosphate oxidase family protein, partial [Bradyrhizobium sp.]
MSIVSTIDQLEAIYGETGLSSTAKVADHVTPHYRVMIEKSPF